MGRAFYGFVLAVRKQPNHAAFAFGIFMFLLPGPMIDTALWASGIVRHGDQDPPKVPAIPASANELWGRFADSGFGLGLALTIMAGGVLLTLLGLARVFLPKNGVTRTVSHPAAGAH